jgi:hypothetical protein
MLMLECLLKNLNNMILFTSLDAPKLNPDHEIDTINFKWNRDDHVTKDTWTNLSRKSVLKVDTLNIVSKLMISQFFNVH